MDKSKIFFFFILTFLSCNYSKKDKHLADQKKPSNNIDQKNLTPKVTGIGGIFFFSDNPKESREWYKKNLGLETNDYGATFEFRNVHSPELLAKLQWTPFKKGSDYFKPSQKDYMINYRVQNIEGMVKNLKESGITVLDEISSYDYGKFVHVMDPEGNKIELWEPVDKVDEKFGENTKK